MRNKIVAMIALLHVVCVLLPFAICSPGQRTAGTAHAVTVQRRTPYARCVYIIFRTLAMRYFETTVR